MSELTLIGHRLCPYVQRVDMALREAGLAYRREDIELDRKPVWLGAVSPGGTVPALQAGDDGWLFESAAIVHYVDLVSGGRLSPPDPLQRARAEAWMRVGDDLLRRIARIIYQDDTEAALQASLSALESGLSGIAERVVPAPYLCGERFGLLDMVYVTIFRYLPVFGLLREPATRTHWVASWAGWWDRVSMRDSVTSSVPDTFQAELVDFIIAKPGHIAARLAEIQPCGIVR